jgi:hypothetical protein
MPKIVLKFDTKSGEVQVEAKGFKGQACEEATEFLKGLGEVTDYEKKASWYETNLAVDGTVQSNLCG